jgi:outer membrane protein assembly factor BamB
VANGVVYVGGDNLWALEATSGAPLWTAAPPYERSSPAVANGLVFAASPLGLRAYDAEGLTGCAGTPKVCSPLWTGPPTTSSPSVGTNGFVYSSFPGAVYAFTTH